MQAKNDHSADSIALKVPFNKRFQGMQSIKAENHLKNFIKNLVKPLILSEPNIFCRCIAHKNKLDY